MTLLRGKPSLQVASTSYQSPVHLYRRILRLANSLARTWDDENIYHAQRYLAQRNVKKWGEAAAADKRGSSSPGPIRALEGEADPSYSSTIQAAQYRPFMRLKSHLSLLQRAHRGGRDEMVKVLDWTYARRGVLRWAGLRPFLSKPASYEDGPAYAVTSLTKGKGIACKPGTSYTPSPALLSLLSSPLITHSPSSNGDSSSSSSLPSFTLPLPREGATGGHPFHKMANKHRNAAAKAIKRKLGRVRVPLGEEVVRGVEGRVRGDTEERLGGEDGKEVRRRREAASSKGRGSSPPRGPLHPDAENFARQKRRVWAALLSRIPILPTPKGAEGEPAVRHAEEKQGRADALSPSSCSHVRRRSSLYLSPSRLPTASIPGLVEEWNRRLSLATSVSAPPAASPSTSNPQSDAPAIARRRSPFFIPFNLSPLSLFRTNEKRPPSVPALASQARVGALLDAERSDEDSAKKGRGEVVEGSRGSGKGKARGRATGAARRMMGSEEEERWVRMT